LTEVEDVKETFRYEDFDAAMFIYRFNNDFEKANKKKHRKQRNKRRTHKKKIGG
jgi:hypothetical protein